MSTGILRILSLTSTQEQILEVSIEVTHTNNLNSIPGAHRIEGKNQILKVANDLHMFTVECACTQTK